MVKQSYKLAGSRVKLKKKQDRALHDTYLTPSIAIEKLCANESFTGKNIGTSLW
jgi:hypothetical protein